MKKNVNMINKSSLIAIVLLSFLAGVAVCENRVVCYHTNWSQYRPSPGLFYPESIDPFLCTHIMYSFAKVSGDTLAPYEWNDESTDWSKGMYERTMAHKKTNPNLKILLAIGGWNHGSSAFSDMVTNDNSRKNFVANSLAYIKKHNFDGLDLDWEYPSAFQGSRPTDRERFTLLVKELKEAYAPQGLLLTAAVAAGKGNIDNAYEVDKISQYLDWINLMTYDLHGTWEPFTGHHAAMYPRSDESGDQRDLNVDWVVNYWLSKGCPRDKLVLGLGTYGRAFKLVNAANTNLGAATAGLPTAGTWTREAGFLSYYEVCQRLNQGWTKKWSTEQAVPYAYSNGEWVGYDDVESLTVKVNFAKSMNLGGIMFWALDLDDFTGTFCGQGKYPLINAAKSLWETGGFTTFPTTTRTLPPTETTTTGAGGSTNPVTATTTHSVGGKCHRGDGYYADKDTKCQNYYQCSNTGQPGETIHYFTCPGGTLFDEKLNVCNWASAVQC